MEVESVAIAGRVLVGLLFVVIGVRLLAARRPAAALLAIKGLPRPLWIVIAGGVFEVVFGLLAIAGIAPVIVFAALALFVVAATAMVHDFWRKTGAARSLELNTVLTHGLIVGSLIVMAVYPW